MSIYIKLSAGWARDQIHNIRRVRLRRCRSIHITRDVLVSDQLMNGLPRVYHIICIPLMLILGINSFLSLWFDTENQRISSFDLKTGDYKF